MITFAPQNFQMKQIYYLLYTTSFLFLLCACKKTSEINLASASTVNANANFVRIATSTQKYTPLSAAYVSQKANEIQTFFDKNWADQQNVSFLVAQNGQIIFEKYQGFADKNTQTLINANTPMHIASISKVMTATAILLLIDANKITINQKVNTILSQFPYPEISIKNLLTHRSGLKNYTYFVEENNNWNPKRTLRNNDIVTIMKQKMLQLEVPADTKFSYCNTNYAVLALIIEKITGLNYINAMKKMIFEPLKMNDTYVFDFDLNQQTAVPSYKGNDFEIPFDYLDAIYGDKNIYSTPRDLLKFDLARNAPNFLNPKLKEAIYLGYSNEHKGKNNYGLGIRMINWETGQRYYFHNGWWHGNTSSYITLPKDNLCIMALSNKFSTKTYKVRELSTLFGDYPFVIDKDNFEE